MAIGAAPGWLVIADGALRGIVSQSDDGELVLAAACDRRIQTPDPMLFRSLDEAHAWIRRRLAASTPLRPARLQHSEAPGRLRVVGHDMTPRRRANTKQ